ncbi:hypothetical protein BV22DRAFT_1190975, partial [Leucogyrophana mollusca]
TIPRLKADLHNQLPLSTAKHQLGQGKTRKNTRTAQSLSNVVHVFCVSLRCLLVPAVPSTRKHIRYRDNTIGLTDSEGIEEISLRLQKKSSKSSPGRFQKPQEVSHPGWFLPPSLDASITQYGLETPPGHPTGGIWVTPSQSLESPKSLIRPT